MVGEEGHAWLSGVAENQQLPWSGVIASVARSIFLNIWKNRKSPDFTLSLIKEMKNDIYKGLPLLLLIASLCSYAALQPIALALCLTLMIKPPACEWIT